MAVPEARTTWTVRAATAADLPAIRALVRSEKLNLTQLDWPAFVVAVIGPEIVGAAQIRRPTDGSASSARSWSRRGTAAAALPRA